MVEWLSLTKFGEFCASFVVVCGIEATFRDSIPHLKCEASLQAFLCRVAGVGIRKGPLSGGPQKGGLGRHDWCTLGT